MATDHGYRILVQCQNFQLSHVSEIEIVQHGDVVSGKTERSKIPQETERFRRNFAEAVVAEVERLEAGFQSPEREELQIGYGIVCKE